MSGWYWFILEILINCLTKTLIDFTLLRWTSLCITFQNSGGRVLSKGTTISYTDELSDPLIFLWYWLILERNWALQIRKWKSVTRFGRKTADADGNPKCIDIGYHEKSNKICRMLLRCKEYHMGSLRENDRGMWDTQCHYSTSSNFFVGYRFNPLIDIVKTYRCQWAVVEWGYLMARGKVDQTIGPINVS